MSELFVGPVTLNCVYAANDVADRYNKRIPLIASRNQIDIDGGYVNNFTTKRYVDFLERNFDTHSKFLLCRDHGGPYQNEKEQSTSFNQAMEFAKESYKNDLYNGFEFLHIDPSKNLPKDISIHDILSYVFELLDYCEGIATTLGVMPIYEFGTEEQSGQLQDCKTLKFFVENIRKRLDSLRVVTMPYFVIQTGTKVMEGKNVGDRSVIDSPQLKDMIKWIHDCGFKVKEHNVDFVPYELLEKRPEVGIDACNVAPEFGTIETKIFVYFLKRCAERHMLRDFQDLVYNSKRYKKWIRFSIGAYTADDILHIAGHYLMGHPNVVRMKQDFKKKHAIDIDRHIQYWICRRMEDYLYFLGGIS